MRWQEKTQRPVPGSVTGEIVLKIKMARLGAMKTIKFDASTVVREVIQRAAKQCGISDWSTLGLYRRSGLKLDPNQTLSVQDVISNVSGSIFNMYSLSYFHLQDILECR